MKIIYTIAGLYRPAGMERILTDKANYLAQHGYEVLIVTTEQKGRPDVFPLEAGIRRADLAIGYEDNNGGSFLSKLVHYPGKKRLHRRRLRELLLAEKPDVTISMFCGDETFLPRIKDGGKKVLEVHFSRFKRLQYGRRGLFALADRYRSRKDLRTIACFDRFVVLTHEDLAYWGNPDNGVVIPNFVNPGDGVSLQTEKSVIGAGRFCYQKGFDRLIDAWAITRKSPSAAGWTLKLYGEGEDEPALRERIARTDISDTVCLMGTTKKMASAYKGASVLALSSRYEGLPMVLLEAQSYGLPIVAFDCKCGPRDVVADGKDGFLVPEGDVQALAEALLTLIKDEALRRRMGAMARENARRWDKENIMKQWTDLLESI